MSPSPLADELRQLLGAENVLEDAATCAEAASDLFPGPAAVAAELVIRPLNTDQTAEALRLLARAGAAVVPRGAGLSYTGGVVPEVPAVVLDTSRMTQIRIEPADLTAVVGAGLSWQALADALAEHKLRVAQTTPISGAVSTVGGLAAQGIPGGMDGILGVRVVLSDGSIVDTGALAAAGGSPFWRTSGPDLTGIFLGDCGAFGIKTEIALRLVAQQPAAFASFAFDDGAAMMDTLVEVKRRGFVARALAMDPVRGRSAVKVDSGEALKTLGAVLAGAGSLRQAARDVTQLARGSAQLGEAAWTLHLTTEGGTLAAAEAGVDAARATARDKGGREIAPAVPKALHARPYSIRGFVGPEGERWVPVHGILPLSRATGCLGALEERIAKLAPDLAEAGISVSHIVSSQGPYVTIEPMFYWPDALDPLHLRHLSVRNRGRFGDAAAHPQARQLVRTARADMLSILDAHGAVHAQVGRYYPLVPRITSDAAIFLRRVKTMLDPSARMNPGVLGL